MQCNLPYIEIKEINARFLLDTGSSRSIICPKIAHKYYQNFIFNENFEITSAHDTSYHNEVAVIPIFQEFRVNDSHKFYLFDFSKNFDGLLGLDFFNKLKAEIKFGPKILETPHVKIPIICDKNLNYKVNIPGRTIRRIQVPVDKQQGVGIMHPYGVCDRR